MRREVTVTEGTQKVLKELVKLKERYNRIIVSIAIEKYQEIVDKEIEVDIEAMKYAMNRGVKREDIG